MQNSTDVQQALASFKSRLPQALQNPAKGGCGIILGTGLFQAASLCGPNAHKIYFSEIAGFPHSSVESHEGCFYIGLKNEMPVIVQSGRCHLYEGYAPRDVVMGVRLMAQLGCEKLIAANAAGALNPLFTTSRLMLIADMINHTGQSPLTGENNDAWGERFPDMSEPFSSRLLALASALALDLGIPLEKGVYIGVHGPEMETPAETRMYRAWGADAVGMSTVLEIIAARHMGMECLGISCLANKNLPDCMREAPLAEIIAVARQCAPKLLTLLDALLAELSTR